MPPEGRYFKFVMPLALELGENSLGREQFGGNHKVKLEKNAGKQTVLSWARWLPVCGCPESAGLNRFGMENERVLQRILSQKLWP